MQNTEYADIIYWNEKGDEVIVKNIGKLCSQALSHYFNHKSYQSFVRQLNKYGFEKVRNTTYDTYKNPLFLRDDKSRLDQIEMKRTISHRPQTQESNSALANELEVHCERLESPTRSDDEATERFNSDVDCCII